MLKINITKELQGSCGAMQLDVNLEVERGSFTAIAGPSGSGKTTLLRVLAGLEKAEGVMRLDTITFQDIKQTLAPQKRHIGFVFQDYALFMNMSVEQNLLYVAKESALVKELLELTKLTELRDRLPATLSGGQQQRVALCRAMMKRPKLLLMDEPLSALDPKMRTALQADILKLHKAFGTTTIMVSHDPSEIYRLADKVIVLEEGKVVQVGTPKEVLLKIQGSQKFSLRGEILEILKADVIYVAVIAIGQQIVEIVLDSKEAEIFKVGEQVQVSTKAFSPSIRHLD